MTKWIWTGLIVVAVTAFVLWQRGGVKTAYVNGLPEYTNLPGKEFIFQRDCYVFKFEDKDTSYPLVGANAPELGIHVPALPPQVLEEQIGKSLEKVRILDVVRSGTRFRLVSVRREQSKEATTITFEILLANESERKYPRLDAYYLLDHTPEQRGAAPMILPEYAVERVKL